MPLESKLLHENAFLKRQAFMKSASPWKSATWSFLMVEHAGKTTIVKR